MILYNYGIIIGAIESAPILGAYASFQETQKIPNVLCLIIKYLPSGYDYPRLEIFL